MIAALTGIMLCVVGAVCASVGLVIELLGRYGARRARAEAERIVSERAGVREDVRAAAVEHALRSPAHCPSCGRFARRLASDITHCARHGMVVRAANYAIPLTLVVRAA